MKIIRFEAETWTCEMGAVCMLTHPPRPHELQWSASGLDTNGGFYCQACIRARDIPIADDAPFLSDILNAGRAPQS